MLIDNVDNFSIWLSDELKVLCEADPVTLSKYVIALLKKDRSETNLKKICMDQLNVFLLEKTKDFVTKLFECLKNKTYIQVIEGNVELKNSHKNDDMPEFMDTYNNINEDDVIFKKLNTNNDLESKKYSPKHYDHSDTDDEKRNSDLKPYTKRSLDCSSYKTLDEYRKKRRFNDEIDIRDKKRHNSKHKSHKNKRHVSERIDSRLFDRTDESKSMNFSIEKKQWDIKTSCPDFVEKGVCIKGDSCQFDHGSNIVRSDINYIYSASGINRSNVNSNWQPMQMNTPWLDNYSISKQNKNLVDIKNIDDLRQTNQITDIYDPSHPEIDAINDLGSRSALNDQAPVYVPSTVESFKKEGSLWPDFDETPTNNCSEASQVTTVIGSAQNRFRRTISPIKRNRFNNQYDNNTTNYKNNYNNKFNNKRTANARCLLVTHIPLDCNDEMKLRKHFSTFGSIVDVEVRFQNDPQHALIEFKTCDQAKDAFRSPLPILDNRFIRTCLFSRPNDSNNLRLCQDADDQNECKHSRKVIQNDSPIKEKDIDMSNDDNIVDKWPQHSQSSDDERTVLVKDMPKRIEKKSDHWPVASDLKLDRRNNVSQNNVDDKSLETKAQIFKDEERNSKLNEAQMERNKKLKALNDRKELKSRIKKLEESVEGCKNRLRSLLEEQKKTDCDKDLVKRQLLESYNYFKELKEMLEPLKKKMGPEPQLSEADMIKMKIKNIQDQLVTMEKDSDIYKKHLKMITEHKRNLIKLQTITKDSKPKRLPTLCETKLDNRPKTLYVTGLLANSSLADVKQYFKKYQIEKIETSDNDMSFFAVEFKTRHEADRVLFEMSKDKKVTFSYDKPIQICDPLDFTSTRSDYALTQRGTPRDNCASSDEDDESKMN